MKVKVTAQFFNGAGGLIDEITRELTVGRFLGKIIFPGAEYQKLFKVEIDNARRDPIIQSVRLTDDRSRVRYRD